jgi:predicted ester cyclase
VTAGQRKGRALLGDVYGVESFQQGFRAFLEPCPDFRATVADLFVSGEMVAVRVTYRGTDRGGMFGRVPTGRTFTMNALYIFRLADRLVRELWQEADRLGMMQQLGAIPAAVKNVG